MTRKPMIDPIIEEIHQTRRKMSDKFNGDFVAMLDDARIRQEASGRPVWQPKPTNKTMLGSLGATDVGVGTPIPTGK